MSQAWASFVLSTIIITLISSLASVTAFIPSVAHADGVNVWWPSNGAHLSLAQPFKAQLTGYDVSQYEMFWQVDGGSWVWMDSNYTDYPHKEGLVDVSHWNWRGNGPYTVNFIARHPLSQGGAVIAQQSVQIYIDSGSMVQSSSGQGVNGASLAASSQLYVNPNSDAAKSGIAAIASQPIASWFGDSWNIQQDVSTVVSAASVQGKTAVLVAYNVPQRDCGNFSSGGSNNPDGYRQWITSFGNGIGNASSIVILEPDALAMMSCLSWNDQQTRMQLLSYAVDTLKSHPNVRVYIDAGHSQWIDAGMMANDLRQSNITRADGFALDVSNFMSTSDETNYGQQISSQIGGKHFVIDTSRNGNGSNGQWCNPSGRALGAKPTLNTGNSTVDAYLWIKIPGESDGSCNGGPNAGSWWQWYAQQLASNAGL